MARAKAAKNILFPNAYDTLFYYTTVSHEQTTLLGKKQCIYTVRNMKTSVTSSRDKR